MPAPPAYDRLYNLTEYAAAHTAAPYDASQHDAEFDAIEQSIDGLISNRTLIQKDDGSVRNGVVGLDALSTAVLGLITAAGGTIKGSWLTGTAYVAKDVVANGTGTYICATAHTAGTFATDLAAAKWVLLYNSANYAASGITFSPTGSVGAGDVQAAIAEVDSEKLAKADNLASVANRATAFNNLVAPGGTMTGPLSLSSARLNEAQGSDIPSATTINLDAATGNLVDVTGTTTITAITLSQGREAVVRFTGVLTLTNGASLVLPGGANITTAAGDFAVFRGYAAGVVRCVSYSRVSGVPLVSANVAVPVRQTVLSGPTTNGLPTFGGSTGGTTVTMAGTLVVTAANGVSAAGSNDRVGSITNASWTGLSTNGTMFLYLDIAADGTCTTGSTTLAPAYQFGGSASTTSGQATFNIQDMQMLVGNGTTADQKWRVFVGEVTVAAAVVSAITWYALQGRYAAVPVAFTTSVAYTFAHNIGVPIEFLDVAPYARSPSSSGPWLPAPLSYSGSTAFPIAGLFGATSRLAVCCYTGAAGVFYDNASNGGNTASSGDLMVRVTRGW